MSFVQEPLSALACFRALSINGVYQDLRWAFNNNYITHSYLLYPCSAPHAVNGGTSCLESYNNVATFNTDSYLQICKSSFSSSFLLINCWSSIPNYNIVCCLCSGQLWWWNQLLVLAGFPYQFLFRTTPLLSRPPVPRPHRPRTTQWNSECTCTCGHFSILAWAWASSKNSL